MPTPCAARRDRRRRLGERVDTAARLRERDHLPDRRLAGEQRGDAVPPERDATVWRGAVGEGVEEEAELLLRLGVVDAHDREHPLLHVAAVDADAAAADLVAVADDVVGVGQGRTGIGLEGVDRLGLGRGERVVHRGPGTGPDGDVAARSRVGGRLEQRRVDDPGERPGVGGSIRPRRCDLTARRTEHARCALAGPAARTHSRRVTHRRARRDPHARRRQVLRDRPPSVPSSATRTYASPLAPRCLAHSMPRVERVRRGWLAPPGMTTAPT